MKGTTLNRHPGVPWSPETRLGAWAIRLAGVALGGLAVLAVAFALGLEPADRFSDDWLLSLAGTAVLASGAAAAVTGVVAILREHERSWSVLCGTACGVLMTVAMVQQVAEGVGWLGR
jgi:invasion protein IalB